MSTQPWGAQTQLLMAFEGVVLIWVKNQTEVSHKHWDCLYYWVSFQLWKGVSKDLLSSNRKPSWVFPVSPKYEYPYETWIYLPESVWDLLLGRCHFWSDNSTLPSKSLRRVMPMMWTLDWSSCSATGLMFDKWPFRVFFFTLLNWIIILAHLPKAVWHS